MFCSLHSALYTFQAAARPVGVHETKISGRLDIQMKSAAGKTTGLHDRWAALQIQDADGWPLGSLTENLNPF